MSKDYVTITDRLVAILTAERTGKLSEDLPTPVKAVRKGQYIPEPNQDKPVVCVRLARTGIEYVIAGNQTRCLRLKFIISGGVQTTTQAETHDQIVTLLANVEQVLENYASDSPYWSAGSTGWVWPHEDEAGADYALVTLEPGQSVVMGHFVLQWACSVRVGRDAL